jgi:hypothetical protein
MAIIPSSEPQLLFSVKGPGGYGSVCEQPVLAGDRIFMSGSELDKDGSGQTCVLMSVEAATGSEQFRLNLPVSFAGREIVSGLPVPNGRGGAWVTVYEQDCSLTVLEINGDGSTRTVNEIGNSSAERHELNIAGYDVANKFLLAPGVLTQEGDQFVSWVYRQGRYLRTECRTRDFQLRWASDDVLVGYCEPDVAICRRYSWQEGGELIAHSMGHGSTLWSMAGDHYYGGSGNGLVFIVDQSDRSQGQRSHWPEIEAAWRASQTTNPASGSLPPSRLEFMDEFSGSFLRKRSLVTSTTVKAIDAWSGSEQWSVRLPGDVVSFRVGPNAVCAICAGEVGTGSLRLIDQQGKDIGSKDIFGEPYGAATPPAEAWPCLIAMDGERVVWMDHRRLVCDRIGALGVSEWEIEHGVEESCYGLLPLIHDRALSVANSAFGQGMIYLRSEGGVLFAFG